MPLATMPLADIPLVSLDLETTGLKPRSDRIIQIGAVEIGSVNEPDTASCFDRLVNPGVPVPISSVAVHGIDDTMLKDAESFALALPDLRNFIQGRILLGYNIGFDLAFLANEAERHSIEWQWAGALCLRQLATVLLGRETMLMIADLEALAMHFKVPVTGRHTALGDARITAQTFRRMQPDLAAKSIVTLADAWRAVAALDHMRQATVQAGWVDVAAAHGQPNSDLPLARIDPYPYQHRISEIMLTAPVILPGTATVGDAARLMKQGGQECVFIGADKSSIEGIVSERDIVHAMAVPIGKVDRARSMPLADIMSSPVISVAGSDHLHIGLGRMSHHDIRHLGVNDENGDLTGWISTRQLVRQRVTKALTIGDQLASADDGGEMSAGLLSLPSLAASLVAEAVPEHQITAVISGQYRAALARAAQLAEIRMREDGHGSPPVEYCVLVLGSAGRDESLLAADQDHAIIYADGATGKADKAQAWFEALGSHIADYLNEGGIPYCKGGVMSSQPKWCRPLSAWRKAVRDWVRRGRPKDVLNVDILFDFVAVHGETTLARNLDQLMFSRTTREAGFLKLLARNTAGSAAGRTLLGGLKTENGRFNVKANILLPMVETLRVLAISRGISVRGSAARAQALFRRDDIPSEVQQLSEDINLALRLLLHQQIRDIAEGHRPTTKIDLRQIDRGQERLLKAVTGRVGRLQTLIQDVLF